MKHLIRLALAAFALGLVACGAHEATPVPAATVAVDKTLVGTWTVNTPGPMQKAMLSFRDDGSARILIPVPDDVVQELNALPPAERDKKMKSVVQQGGQTYVNAAGTWKTLKPGVIHVGMESDGQTRGVDYTVQHPAPGRLELVAAGESPMLLSLSSPPLPAT